MNESIFEQDYLVNFKKLNSKELYGTLMSLRFSIPTSQNHFNNKFGNQNLNWKNVCIVPRKLKLDSHFYKSRSDEALNLNYLINFIKKPKKIEYNMV